MLELKRLKELQHDNLVRFRGACLETGTAKIVLLLVQVALKQAQKRKHR